MTFRELAVCAIQASQLADQLKWDGVPDKGPAHDQEIARFHLLSAATKLRRLAEATSAGEADAQIPAAKQDV